MEKDNHQEALEGIRNQFRWSLQALASNADVQLSLFPDFVCKTDELALDFDHWARVAREHFSELTKEQIESLEKIDSKLGAMSNGGVEWTPTLWTEKSLYTRHEWEEVRSMAKHALELFGWPLENPPSGRSLYAPGTPTSSRKRQIFFRSLAGMMAVGSVWAMVSGELSLQRSLSLVSMTLVFATFALFGNRAADHVLAFFSGTPKPPPRDAA